MTNSTTIRAMFSQGIISRLLQLSNISVLSNQGASTRCSASPIIMRPLNRTRKRIYPLPTQSYTILIMLLRTRDSVRKLRNTAHSVISLTLRRTIRNDSRVRTQFLSTTTSVTRIRMRPYSGRHGNSLQTLSFTRLIRLLLRKLIFQYKRSGLRLRILRHLFSHRASVRNSRA